jgi:hypothetical protein
MTLHPGRAIAFAALLGACEPPEQLPTGDTDGPSACGTPVRGIELQFLGKVLRTDGGDDAGVRVTLEDRSTAPPTELGTALTTAGGSYTLNGDDITDWPGCWLTLLDYRLVAEDGDVVGELQVNRFMQEAIRAEQDTVDLTTRPITLR